MQWRSVPDLYLPGTAVAGLEMQLISFHEGVCVQINAQSSVRALGSLGGANTHPGVSFIQWMCVLDPLCLQLHLFYTYFTPTSLITHHLLVVWQVAVYIPEVKPHFQGASTIYSILKPGFTGMAHHLQSPAL